VHFAAGERRLAASGGIQYILAVVAVEARQSMGRRIGESIGGREGTPSP